jgi:hypothetical protein
MTEPTWLRQRVPCDVVLGVDDDGVCVSPTREAEESANGEQVLSDMSAELTWRLLREDSVTRREMSEEAMVAVVRRLLA